MRYPLILCFCALALIPAAQGQSLFCSQVAIDDNDPTTGTSNAFPFGSATANGFTTIHVYTAAQLSAGGILAGAVLTDVEVAPSSGTSGIYSAPTARMVIGHAPNTLVAGLWEANIVGGVVIHDLTDGPYTFPWTLAEWTRLPGIAAGGFAWNGVDDIAIFYTSSAVATGTFSARRTVGNLRHALNVFNATTQTPQSNGNFAMEVRLSFNATNVPDFQSNSAASSMTIDGVGSSPCAPASRRVPTGTSSNLRLDSANVGFGWEVGFTVFDPLLSTSTGASSQPGYGFGAIDVININFFAPSFALLNLFSFPPFPGAINLPLSAPPGVNLSAQMFVVDPASLTGFTPSGPVTFDFL